MTQHLLKTALVFALFLAAAWLAFGQAHKATAVVLILSGVSAIAFSRSVAVVHERITAVTGRRGPFTPRTVVLWGAGLVILGLAWFTF